MFNYKYEQNCLVLVKWEDIWEGGVSLKKRVQNRENFLKVKMELIIQGMFSYT